MGDATDSVPVALAKPGRRRQSLGKTFESKDGANLTDRQIDFGKTMDAYKRERGRFHPSYSQVLDVIDSMGYRLVAPAIALPA